MLEIAETREEMPLPDYEDVAGAIVRQLGASALAFPCNEGRPTASHCCCVIDWTGRGCSTGFSCGRQAGERAWS